MKTLPILSEQFRKDNRIIVASKIIEGENSKKSCTGITQAPKDSVLISKGSDTSKTKSLAEASEIIKSSKKLKELAGKFEELTGIGGQGYRSDSTGVVKLEGSYVEGNYSLEEIVAGIYGVDELGVGYPVFSFIKEGEEAIAAFKNEFTDNIADPQEKTQLSELLNEIGKVFQNGNFAQIVYLNARWDEDTSLTALVGINKDNQMIGIYRNYYSIF